MVQAVFFDVLPKEGSVETYFSMAASLRPIVEKNPGFVAVERFENLQESGWFFSFSQWRDELALAQWRCQPDHYGAQVCGRSLILADYRLRVAAQQVGAPIQSEIKERELVAMLIGNFAAIEHAFKARLDAGNDLQLFRGVIDAQRGIGLVNHISGPVEFAASTQYELRYFEVCRDYGMFDRAQAPQQFA
ncbi:antibiotic biosynthesis monooxygenase [Polynucleobacter sp. IMCC30063]|uniref:antibiotic biosynthesis monooxygenase family protein n=1 Tax=Polynucleobacter sp. IMCC30063 TaxID=2907298 RepID=UPI001F190B1C|nr:antibiotic biosynthesis monooxygenase [Polynucleobacter sp. IMCC30063]MCE7506108.1 antibiotic biosynthesis monooxygenase [Polynucleobacter sp. IMCC30063]